MRQKIDLLCEGNVAAEDIINNSGVLLIGKGAVLGKDTISFLREQHITSVEIESNFDLLTEAEMEKRVMNPPPAYSIPANILEEAVDEKSVFKEEYATGIEAIRNVDVDATMDVAKSICEKVTNAGNLQEELSMLKNGFDSVLTHSMNVAIMTASIIVWQANMTDKDYYESVAGAILHDIGKMYVPREVLDKPGKLTPEEYSIIQQHTSLGYMKLRAMGNVSEKIMLMAYQHHENVDGSGYPHHLKDNEILPESKIIHIADVYEAMTAKRVYKDPMLPGDVTEFTMSKYGQMFDQQSLRTFLRTVPAYKRGDMVMLSNHQLAEVIACNQLNSLRPKVRLLMTGEELDLFRDKNNLNITIVEMA